MAEENKDKDVKKDFTIVAQQCRRAKEADLNDLIKQNEGAIKNANIRERRLGRVGMPWGYQIDNWTDEIPVVCGIKKAVVWAGSAAGCIWLGTKVKQVFFG